LNRREVLKGMGGGLAIWAYPHILHAQSNNDVVRLTDKLVVVDVGGSNVLAFSYGDGFVLVDSGAAAPGGMIIAATHILAAAKAPAGAVALALFNTHYHAGQTGNNEAFGAAGTRIIAHEHTRQWMSTGYWVPEEDRYEKARPKAAQPSETFRTTGSLNTGTEQIDYGHLPLAHTDGDIYVFFRTSNVLAAGDVASPLRDPALDSFTGAWLGGRLDAMDTIHRLCDEQTKIVPAAGPVMSRAEFKAERDMMEEVRSRVWKQTLQGDSPKDMLEAGVLKGLPRTWKDPYQFLYDAAKGMFAHHNKLDPSVV
jgi:cyclase